MARTNRLCMPIFIAAAMKRLIKVSLGPYHSRTGRYILRGGLIVGGIGRAAVDGLLLLEFPVLLVDGH